MRADEPARLCLLVEARSNDGCREWMEAALGTGAVAAVVIEPPASGMFDLSAAKMLTTLAQSRDVAATVVGDAQLARALEADGVHLPWGKDLLDRYREARELLGPSRIVGIDAGRSRHDAMTLGEAGADYVGFGIPAHVEARETARARRLDLIAWWAEIFEVPAIAFDVETIEDAAELAAAGADFIAVRLSAAESPAEAADRFGAFARAIRLPQSAG